jgi:pyrimidine-specific ribonucleoside hydrolase
MHRTIAAVSLLACLVSGCQPAIERSASPSAPTIPSPGASAVAGAARVPVIIDSDFDLSDIGAILVLLRDPAVDVEAIAVDGTGLVHCQGGLRVARYLLEQMGVPDIPFGCGRQRGGDDATPFPDDWRAAADDGFGLDIAPRVETEFPADAVTVISDAIGSNPRPVTIVALGPLTNLEDAFAADPTLAHRIAAIHAMLGTVDAPGNVFVNGHDRADPLEWNAFADPSAVRAVFATDVPIDLVPLDATDDVPVPADLADRLARSHAAAGADLMHELLLRNPSRLAADQGQQLWDELAALTVSDPGLMTWDDASVSVGADGRISRDAAGRKVRYGSAADAPAVETALVDALGRGGPRANPSRLVGTIEVTWDRKACTATNDGSGAGLYTVSYSGPVGSPSAVYIAGIHEPHTWSDLVAFLATVDVVQSAGLPDWIILGGQVSDQPGAGYTVTGTAEMESATYGPVCVTGTWPNQTFTPGEPFTMD